jgi:3'-5' exoribonuclease
MGKSLYVTDIREREIIETSFLVTEKVFSQAKNGQTYLKLKLRDRTGEIEGRIWEDVEQKGALFDPGDLVTVKAEVIVYQGQLQLNILDLRPCSEEEMTLEDFIPPPRRDPQKMLEELKELAFQIEDPYLRRLVLSFLRDEAFLEAFLKVPASKKLHHARLGGLLEHTLSVAKLVTRLKGHYEGIDWDLLLAGAILHDIGKAKELQIKPSFEYTTSGKLLGHIVIGLEMISKKIEAIEGFPPEKALLIKHLLISHHGRGEWGSPERPKTIEAELLHRLDDLDAKIEGILDFIRGSQGTWTDFHKAFERSFFRGENRENLEG